MNKSINCCCQLFDCNTNPTLLAIEEKLNAHVSNNNIHVSLEDKSRWNKVDQLKGIVDNIDLSSYAKKDDVQKAIESAINNIYIPTYYVTEEKLEIWYNGKKNDIYVKEEVYNKTETYSKTDVYNKTEVYNKNEIYSKLEVYNKLEVNTKIETVTEKITDLDKGIEEKIETITKDVANINKAIDDIKEDCKSLVKDVTYDSDTNVLTVIKKNDSKKEIQLKSSGGIVGEIKMWPKNEAPEGYLICDGQSFTEDDYPELYTLLGGVVPDLRGRFVVGMDSNDSSYDTVGKTGGANTVKLTNTQCSLREHGHPNAGTSSDGWHFHTIPFPGHIFEGDDYLEPKDLKGCEYAGADRGYGYKGSCVGSGNHTHSVTIPSEGGSKYDADTLPHENRPPYYVLTYIIKAK